MDDVMRWSWPFGWRRHALAGDKLAQALAQARAEQRRIDAAVEQISREVDVLLLRSTPKET